MELFNRMDAARMIGVSMNTVEGWANNKRIRVFARSKGKPFFTKEAIEEVKAERAKDPKNMPSIKEEDPELVAS